MGVIFRMVDKKIFLIILFFLSGCANVPDFNSHNDVFYEKYIDKKYKTLIDMPVFYAKNRLGVGVLGGYFVMLPPGVKGRYVSHVGTLRKRSIVQVDRIKTYKKKILWWTSAEFYVKIINNEKFSGKEVHIYGDNIGGTIFSKRQDKGIYLQTKDKKYDILNPKYFEEIKTKE